MKTLLRFLTLSCLVTLCGYTADAATGDQVVKMDAVRYMLNNNAPAQMDKEKFLDKLCSADVVNVRELLIACTAGLPDSIACDECKKFITGIINYHNQLLQGTLKTTPSVVAAAPVAPTTPGAENPNGNASGTPTTPGAENPSGVTPNTPTTPGAQNPSGATPNTPTTPSAENPSGNAPATPTTPGAENPSGNAPATPTTPGAENPSGNTPTTVTPGAPVTFKSVCENDGGTYSKGKHTYNMSDWDGEWCGGNKTACVKLFAGTGISVRGVADNSGKIYCFVGTEKDNFKMPGNRVIPDEPTAPKPTYCMYGGNRWQNGIKTDKVTCNPDNPFSDSARGDCTCTCNNGKWNCVKTEHGAKDACTFDGKTFEHNAKTIVETAKIPSAKSHLDNSLTADCSCVKGQWSCVPKTCKDNYLLKNVSGSYKCMPKPCAGVDKSKFEKVEEINGKCKVTCPYGQVLNDNKTGCGPRYNDLFGSNSDFL